MAPIAKTFLLSVGAINAELYKSVNLVTFKYNMCIAYNVVVWFTLEAEITLSHLLPYLASSYPRVCEFVSFLSKNILFERIWRSCNEISVPSFASHALIDRHSCKGLTCCSSLHGLKCYLIRFNFIPECSVFSHFTCKSVSLQFTASVVPSFF